MAGRKFFRKNGVLAAAGSIALALAAFAAQGVRSHNHDAGVLQMAAACGAHGARCRVEACPLEGKDDDAAGKVKSHCPVITGRDKDEKCQLKAVIGNRVVCPVMENNSFTVTADTIAATHDGKVYFFCCPPCENRFKAEPEKYTRHQVKDDGHEGRRHH